LSDKTDGIATNLPWGVDFGDGISRHPTQLYEILFLCIRDRYLRAEGDLSKFYMVSYLGFWFSIDFNQPDFDPVLELRAIQIACLLAIFSDRGSIYQLFPSECQLIRVCFQTCFPVYNCYFRVTSQQLF
jgi:phosphatidylglycerol---prolipoprotein diacylglyceryl transferase